MSIGFNGGSIGVNEFFMMILSLSVNFNGGPIGLLLKNGSNVF